jgi:hypothetical protein
MPEPNVCVSTSFSDFISLLSLKRRLPIVLLIGGYYASRMLQVQTVYSPEKKKSSSILLFQKYEAKAEWHIRSSEQY